MAIFYPPPPPFMGGRQPLESRELPPSFLSAPPDDPPRLNGTRSAAVIAVIAAAWQPAAPQPQAARYVPVAVSATPENNPPFGLKQPIWPIIHSWQPTPVPPWRERWATRYVAAIAITGVVSDPPFSYRVRPDLSNSWNPDSGVQQPVRNVAATIVADLVNDPPFNHSGRLDLILDQWQPDPSPQKQPWRHVPVSVDDPPFGLPGTNLRTILDAWTPPAPLPWPGWILQLDAKSVEVSDPPFSHPGRNPMMTIIGMWQREWVTVDAYSVVTIGRSTLADDLRFYFTGATSDGGTQTAQASCLGNFRSSTETKRVHFLISTPIPNVEVLGASRFNGVRVEGNGLGVGIIYATGSNTLAYVAPGNSTLGAPVTFANGETKDLTDVTNPSKWVRVKRTSVAQFAGAMAIEFLDLFNDAIGMSNAAEAESSVGSNRYRSVMFRNSSTGQIIVLQLYVKPLVPTATISNVTQLSGVGAGTIAGANDGFCGWPFRGWAHVRMVGGSLREAVYYSSRTDTVLTVAALGRSRLGTAASAGTNTDSIWSVPGIRIGFEKAVPFVNGSVQTIANESTAPATGGFIGGGWSLFTTPTNGIQVGTLNPQEQGSIWIHRELPASVSAIAQVLNAIGVRWGQDSVVFDETLAGMYRIADDDLKKYEIHIGVNAEPDLTAAPTETTATLPFDTTYQIPINTKVFVAVNYRNEYDLRSQNQVSTVIEVDGTNNQITPVPIAPTIILWQPASAGSFHLVGEYDIASDLNPGDQFKIYFTNNGVDPTTADLLATVAIVRGGPMGRAYLDYTTGSYADGTTGKVRIAINRTSDSRLSALSATATAIASTGGAITPTGAIGQKRVFIQDQS